MKMKLVILLTCIAMPVSLTACGSSDKSNSEQSQDEIEVKQAEEEQEVSEEGLGEVAEQEEQEQVDTDEQDESDSLEDTALISCFENLAKQIGLANYEDAIRYVEDTGFDYDTVEPDIDEMGTITTDDDENGCHLFISVFPDDQGENTISSLSYGNGHFEGSVGDNSHVTDPVYNIYNIYNESPNTEVGSLDDVLTYIRYEMPALMDEDNAREPGEPIDVTLGVTGEVTDEGTIFTVDTNLPDGTKMMVSLDVNGKSRSADATVEDGKAATVAMTEDGSPLKGEFEVRVSMVNAVQQPAEVQTVVGVDGENLSGEYLSETIIGEPTISGTFNVSVN